MTHDLNVPIDRRQALRLLGMTGAGAVLLGGVTRLGDLPLFSSPEALAASSSTCTLTPEVTEGPYYIENSLSRRDIRAGQKGLLLDLRLTVVDASTCKVLSGADVEIWHANAQGLYSGYGSSPGQGTVNTKRYLRGHQKSRSTGVARFYTIYPGWYVSRSPHIHIKVHVGGRTVHTGQLFFKDSLSSSVYATSRYKSHGKPDTTNASDSIYASAGGSSARLRLTQRGSSIRSGFVGRGTLAVES